MLLLLQFVFIEFIAGLFSSFLLWNAFQRQQQQNREWQSSKTMKIGAQDLSFGYILIQDRRKKHTHNEETLERLSFGQRRSRAQNAWWLNRKNSCKFSFNFSICLMYVCRNSFWCCYFRKFPFAFPSIIDLVSFFFSYRLIYYSVCACIFVLVFIRFHSFPSWEKSVMTNQINQLIMCSFLYFW